MRRIYSVLVSCCALLSCVSLAHADVEATYVIGLPDLTGSLARYPIRLEYASDTNEEVVFLSLDVAGSHAALTGGGTDFTRFNFLPAGPLFGEWDQLPGTGFGPSADASSIEFDTFTAPLVPGDYFLGTLEADFAGTPLPVGEHGAVTLASVDSVVGVEVAGQIGSFRFVQADVRIEVVPEPIAWSIILSLAPLVPLMKRKKA